MGIFSLRSVGVSSYPKGTRALSSHLLYFSMCCLIWKDISSKSVPKFTCKSGC